MALSFFCYGKWRDVSTVVGWRSCMLVDEWLQLETNSPDWGLFGNSLPVVEPYAASSSGMSADALWGSLRVYHMLSSGMHLRTTTFRRAEKEYSQDAPISRAPGGVILRTQSFIKWALGKPCFSRILFDHSAGRN